MSLNDVIRLVKWFVYLYIIYFSKDKLISDYNQ
jgi:hypothetical protein